MLRVIVDAAQGWAEKGFTPMAVREKKPLAKEWQTLDHEAHLLLIQTRPPPQIGLRMGTQRDGRILIAIDIDGDEGEASLAYLLGSLGGLPATLTQRTGKGRHLVFEWPAERAAEAPTVSRSKLAPGIDIRCQGGHIVAAPSPHESGKQYELDDEEQPDRLPDQWVQRVVDTHAAKGGCEPPRSPQPRSADTASPLERCRRYIAKKPPARDVHDGSRGAWPIAQIAVRGFKLSRSEAESVLREYLSTCDGKPWTAREITHKLDQAEKKSRLPWGYLLDAPRQGWQPEWDGEPSEPPAAPPAQPVLGNPDWRSLLSKTRGTKTAPPVVKKCLENVLTTLLHCPEWQGVVRYNAFTDRVEVCGPLPRASTQDGVAELGEWRDGFTLWVIAWFHEQLDFEPSIDSMSQAITEVARSHAYHPVRDYLKALRWDRKPRCDRMLVDLFAAEDTEVNRTIAAKWMISAVARVMQPGCQVDHLLVLEGEQGTRKSTALRALVGDDWFRNSTIDLRSKDAAGTLRGCWVYEFDELDAFRGRDATRIKSFITLRVDSYRPPYGRTVVDVPRECAFVGSTNEERYLHDTTGNRRFWPVRCGAIDIPGLTAVRDQLWAEAYARYASGELWYVDSPTLSAQLSAVQEQRREVDPWVDIIEAWLSELHETRLEQGVSTVDVMTAALDLKPGQTTRHDEMRIAAALKELGLERRRARRKGRIPWLYFWPTEKREQARLPNLN